MRYRVSTPHTEMSMRFSMILMVAKYWRQNIYTRPPKTNL